jgi:hypothetical protein
LAPDGGLGDDLLPGLRAGLLPLLVESGESDDTLRVNFYEIHGIAVPGGRAAVEIIDDNLYLVVSLRNVGNGIAVLQAAVSGPSGRAPAPTRRRSTRSACSRGTSMSPPPRSASGRPPSAASRPTSGSCSCPGSSRAI